MKTLLAVCILFLLHAANVESRRHRTSDQDQPPSYKLFVFGDTFADSGNTEKEELTQWTRNWYHPYGISDSNHSFSATGRYSNGKVQSDFVAMILGHDESPPAESQSLDEIDPFGMNFAVAFAGVYNDRPPSLREQIERFRTLVRHGVISRDLSQSVALIAFSGYDYADIPDEDTDYRNFVNFIDGVTDRIATGVRRLQALGVSKVLVNMLHPIGCTPAYTRTTKNYTDCIRDRATEIHNSMITKKLGSEESVLLLDLYTAFTNIVNAKTGSGFQHRHIPCCESNDVNGYCGQVDGNGNELFSLCEKPHRYFYWDDWHPTQGGWRAVMAQLEGPIKEFLGI